jgi:hypothetical protein
VTPWEPWHEDAKKGWDLLSWEGAAQWFARQGDRVLGGRLRSLDALIGTIRNAEALGWNLYLNANPTRHVPGRKKLARGDVTHWRYIVVDLDPTADALEPPRPEADNPEYPMWVMGQGVPAHGWLLTAHRIFSGRGYQYWLPVGVEPIMLEGERQARERIMQGYLDALAAQTEAWAPGWKVDPACSDLARVVRCPGSVNQRTGRRSAVEHVSKSAVDPAEIQKYQRQEFVREPAAVLPENVNLLQLLPHLNVRARTFILGGAEPGERHRACYATCKNMHELGVSSGRAFDLLMIGNTWTGLEKREVKKVVEQVYGRN